ncbi:HNH endonuclease signature motif containing protein [Microbacterium kunmingense]|uniref:HNH endonuclease signature motif containing protein n=1 Tax=Microbacterium kunmingense TaxID=2915939 RepID=UPI002006CC26|nr:HNH endonuclease signature motif containing protein [Microbacterium kunmingense]
MDADEKRRQAEEKRAGVFADELAKLRRRRAALEAKEARLLADAYALTVEQRSRIGSVSSRERDMPLRSMALELGLAVRVNDRSMQSQMHDAHELVERFPQTMAALEDGRVSRAHAQVIQDAGRVIEDPVDRASFERIVLVEAERQTVPRTKTYARQRAEVLDPRPLQERHDTAIRQRRVWVTDLDDTLSALTIVGGNVYIHGAYHRLTGQGTTIKDIDRAKRRAYATARAEAEANGSDGAPAEEAEPWFDDRALDEIRCDLALDMLLAGSPVIDPTDPTTGGLGAIRAEVQITIPITTLTGVTNSGAELNGVTPVDPDTARRMAGTAKIWERVMTDPITGVVTAVDRYQLHPSQTRYLNARDVTCRTPGCRRPAKLCHIDHSKDFALGGKSCNDNLCNECARHHTLKHATNWHVEQLPGGILKFTSPGGKTYDSHPPSRVAFVPTDDNGGYAVAPF